MKSNYYIEVSFKIKNIKYIQELDHYKKPSQIALQLLHIFSDQL